MLFCVPNEKDKTFYLEPSSGVGLSKRNSFTVKKDPKSHPRRHLTRLWRGVGERLLRWKNLDIIEHYTFIRSGYTLTEILHT